MACNEFGPGRLSEPEEIVAADRAACWRRPGRSAGRRALVTSGPTREAIDPVRYISNHSSGKQGHAIAAALARLGAEVTLVSGPVALADPPGLRTVHVELGRPDARGLPGRGHRRRRRLRRRRRRLEGRRPGRTAKIKKTAGRGAAGAGSSRPIPTSSPRCPARPRPAGAGRGLCRRDREPGGQRHRQAPAQGLRLDRRQRRLARCRAPSAASATRCT